MNHRVIPVDAVRAGRAGRNAAASALILSGANGAFDFWNSKPRLSLPKL